MLEGVEQALDQAGQLGPLTFVQMQTFGAKLQLALQSRGLLEVPPKSNPTNGLADLKARLRKLEMAEGNLPDTQAPAAGMPPRGGARGRGRGGGRGRGRGAEAAPAVPAGKCFVCGQVGC